MSHFMLIYSGCSGWAHKAEPWQDVVSETVPLSSVCIYNVLLINVLPNVIFNNIILYSQLLTTLIYSVLVFCSWKMCTFCSFISVKWALKQHMTLPFDGSWHICVCCTIVVEQSFLLLSVHAAGQRTKKCI